MYAGVLSGEIVGGERQRIALRVGSALCRESTANGIFKGGATREAS